MGLISPGEDKHIDSVNEKVRKHANAAFNQTVDDFGALYAAFIN